MAENYGGPAFPSEQGVDPSGCWNQTYAQGMSLRDYFAAHVLTGMARGYRSATGCDSDNMKKVMALDCKIAYALADAMLKARGNDE